MYVGSGGASLICLVMNANLYAFIDRIRNQFQNDNI